MEDPRRCIYIGHDCRLLQRLGYGWTEASQNAYSAVRRHHRKAVALLSPASGGNARDGKDLARRLLRSAAYDGTENQSHAYGYFLDDFQADKMSALFVKRRQKASPFVGFYQTPERITKANMATYRTIRSALRSSISFHWRPQPIILVSEDGRSATLRARLLQPSTSMTRAGSFNSAMYHDQVVLENGKWRLWSVSTDEFYWQSSYWKEGWSHAMTRKSSQPNTEPPAWRLKFPPDLTIADVGERESSFSGGSGQLIQWPEIQRMWIQYRNPVSGRRPEWYWPGCVPSCVSRRLGTGVERMAGACNRIDLTRK
jgi:hypothetical protein